MTFPSSFHRLVIAGSLYTEKFATSLSIIPVSGFGLAEPTGSLLTAVQNAVLSFWTNGSGTGVKITPAARVTSVKLNRINAAGHYEDATTHEALITSGNAGAGTTYAPAQISCVLSLRTAVERGLASKGRMYLPTVDGFGIVGPSDGLASASDVTRTSQACSAFITAINAAYVATGGDFLNGKVGVASDKGAGAFRVVTRVSVGRVPDTMRSRRHSLIENPIYTAVT